jgi:hypothetical protein
MLWDVHDLLSAATEEEREYELQLASQGSEDKSSAYGKVGGQLRHQETQKLKTWALTEAATMQQQHRDIARILAQRMPDKFITASKDPERLIYDALREQQRKKRTAGGLP